MTQAEGTGGGWGLGPRAWPDWLRLMLLVAAALLSVAILQWMFGASSVSNSAIEPAPEWQLHGQQGTEFFVSMSGASDLKDQARYRKAAADICSDRSHCGVHFWVEGADVPRRLPMTPDQVGAKVAHYSRNRASGLDQMMWRCMVFPQTPHAECF